MKEIMLVTFSVLAGASLMLCEPPQDQSLTITLPTNVRMEFVRIAAGSFMMGCSPGDIQCADDEKPAHRVRISRPFEMSKYEVTAAQWQAVTVRPPAAPIPGAGDNRAYGFSGWSTAQEFVNYLNERKDGFRYRLPTEAEWEYAARAGSTAPHSGPDVNAIAWIGQNIADRPETVGQKRPNAWGLYDMQGNAWEWVQDWYHARYYGQSPESDPQGPEAGEYRVARGGSALTDARSARVSARRYVGPQASVDYYGLRVVREAIR
jgi:formylglycine-generating enzyme required for sulfatase activity